MKGKMLLIILGIGLIVICLVVILRNPMPKETEKEKMPVIETLKRNLKDVPGWSKGPSLLDELHFSMAVKAVQLCSEGLVLTLTIQNQADQDITLRNPLDFMTFRLHKDGKYLKLPHSDGLSRLLEKRAFGRGLPNHELLGVDSSEEAGDLLQRSQKDIVSFKAKQWYRFELRVLLDKATKARRLSEGVCLFRLHFLLFFPLGSKEKITRNLECEAVELRFIESYDQLQTPKPKN